MSWLSCKSSCVEKVFRATEIIGPTLLTVFFSIPVVAAPGESEALDCLIDPAVTVSIGSSVTGLLSKVPVDRGDLVKKGQVIAELESGVESATVALAKVRASSQVEIDQAQTRLDYQTKQEARLEVLLEKNTVSKESLDKAKTERILAELELSQARVNMELAKLELKRARELLKQRAIVSPVTGVVMERELFVGEYVNETSHIMKVAQTTPLSVEVFVPMHLLGQIRTGMSANIMLEEPLRGIYNAEVTIVDQVMDAASSTIGVRLQLDNHDYSIPIGIKCKVVFQLLPLEDDATQPEH